MEPESSKEVSITHWEWTPERMSLRGRMPDATLAFKYTQELKSIEALAPFALNGPPPAFASDGSASFELKGGLGE